jgi:hypothetical protein
MTRTKEGAKMAMWIFGLHGQGDINIVTNLYLYLEILHLIVSYVYSE